MNRLKWLTLVLTLAGFLSLTVTLSAQEEGTDPPSSQPEDADRDDGGAPPAEQDTFIPTEKINADTEISFPVDI